MLRTWFGFSRSNTSGSRIAGNERVPRITGRNCGIDWKRKTPKIITKSSSSWHQFLFSIVYFVESQRRPREYPIQRHIWNRKIKELQWVSSPRYTFLKVSVVGLAIIPFVWGKKFEGGQLSDLLRKYVWWQGVGVLFFLEVKFCGKIQWKLLMGTWKRPKKPQRAKNREKKPQNILKFS